MNAVMDQAPCGVNRVIIWVARSIGMLTLGGYAVLVLYIFQVIGPSPAAAFMTLAAGAKLLHDALIAFVQYRLKTAFLHVTLYDVSVSFFAGALLLAAVAIQLWGHPKVQ